MTRCRMNVAAALLVLVWSTPAHGQAAARDGVAVISDLSGTAAIQSPRKITEKRSVTLYDWIPAGALITVAEESRLTLVLSSGKRFSLESASRAIVTPSGLTQRVGTIRELGALSPLPSVSPIVARERPVGPAGAVRVRSVGIRGLYPAFGATTRAEQTVISFAAADRASRYRVRVDDAAGRVVFEEQTGETRLIVSPGRLRPGTSYYWTVETVDRFGGTARGQAEFVTITKDAERARDALVRSLPATDARALGLLAAIDRRLGLLREARESLRAAVALAPEDAALSKALAEVERHFGERALDPTGADASAGVVVEAVTKNFAGDPAGLAPGDVPRWPPRSSKRASPQSKRRSSDLGDRRRCDRVMPRGMDSIIATTVC